MNKKINIALEGSSPIINSLFLSSLKKFALTFKPQLALTIVKGLKDLKGKTGCNILLLTVFNEIDLLEKVTDLKTKSNNLKIILISDFIEGDFICALYKNGIDAHISTLDEITDLQKAIENIVANKIFNSVQTDKIILAYYAKAHTKNYPKVYSSLTEKEQLVLKYLCKGLTSPAIAKILFRDTKTIDSHRQKIYDKLGIHNISDLHVWARKNKFDFES